MALELVIGRTYVGPMGRDYTLLAIEDQPGDVARLVIRSMTEGCGTIRFPKDDAAKWLKALVL
jgi:hypothetical protein